MSNFTPGPWEWVEGSPIISRQWNGKDWPVATVANRNLGWHENHNCEAQESGANAQLIAAAPEMYDALNKALSFVEEELAVRRASFLPDKSPYIDEAVALSDAISAALAKVDGKQEPNAL